MDMKEQDGINLIDKVIEGERPFESLQESKEKQRCSRCRWHYSIRTRSTYEEIL